ncbi:hypothetical protein GA0115235_101170 [Streptomyces sp. DpondAA-F4a]|nr:hypothetical protein GA0115235_101170 [Streptomyces sp. DpondAA-F4a]
MARNTFVRLLTCGPDYERRAPDRFPAEARRDGYRPARRPARAPAAGGSGDPRGSQGERDVQGETDVQGRGPLLDGGDDHHDDHAQGGPHDTAEESGDGWTMARWVAATSGYAQMAVSTRSCTCWCARRIPSGAAATALDSAVTATVAARPSSVTPPKVS